MFKVSLLPESYKKSLEGKRKKDLILKVAVMILLCMLIIYAGFAAKMFILKGQLRKIEQKNSVVAGQISGLQQYKDIYDSLAIAKTRVETVKPRTPSALKFYYLVRSQKPEYIKINSIATSDWAGGAICTIEGTLSAARTLEQAVDHLDSYQKTFMEDKAYGGVVKNVKVVNDGMPQVDSIDGENGKNIYSFRIYVSLGGEINVDESGILVTTETTTAAPTTATDTTAASENSETSSSENASDTSSTEASAE